MSKEIYETNVKDLQIAIDKYIKVQAFHLKRVKKIVINNRHYIKSDVKREEYDSFYVINEIKYRTEELRLSILWRTEYNKRLKDIKKLDKNLSLNLPRAVLIDRLIGLSNTLKVRSTLIPVLAFKALESLACLQGFDVQKVLSDARIKTNRKALKNEYKALKARKAIQRKRHLKKLEKVVKDLKRSKMLKNLKDTRENWNMQQNHTNDAKNIHNKFNVEKL